MKKKMFLVVINTPRLTMEIVIVWKYFSLFSTIAISTRGIVESWEKNNEEKNVSSYRAEKNYDEIQS